MKLFVAALLLVAVQAATLGSNKCTQGPSYWCSSIETASKCQSFSLCLDTVWKTQLLDVQQTEVCKYSQKVVKTVRRVLPIKNAQEEATHLIATICSFARDDTMRKECKNLVTHFLPKIFKLMESDVEPATVAALMGLCKLYDDSASNKKPRVEESPYYPPTNSTMCTDCKAFVTDSRTLTSIPGTENYFLKVIDPIICSELGDLAVLCKALIEVGLPKVFDKEYWPDMACQLSTFCINTMEEKPKWNNVYDNMKGALLDLVSDIQLRGEEDIFCHGCEKDLTAVISGEKDSYFSNAIEDAIVFLCCHTGRSEDTCRKLAEGFIPSELTSIMSRDVNVKDVCKSTLGCKEPESPLIVTASNTTFCNDCIRFFADVRAILRDNMLVPEAAALVKEQLCHRMEQMQFLCEDFADSITRDVLSWLAKVDRPDVVCSDITLCPKTVETSKFDFVRIFDAAWEKKPLGSINCDKCQAFVLDARTSGRTPNVQSALVDFFNIICDKLGHETKECKDLIQQYSSGLSEILASIIDPSLVCDNLLHCIKPKSSEESEEATRDVGTQTSGSSEEVTRDVGTQTSGEAKDAEKEKSATPIGCELCKVVISKVRQLIGENRSEEVIQHALDDICEELPAGITPQCLSFVDEYTSVVVQLVQQELDPDQICLALGLCSSSSAAAAVAVPRALPMADSEAGPLECELCKAIITEINSLIKDNRTEAAVIHVVERVCDVVQGDLRLQCKSEVENYGPAVLDLLWHMDDPTQVCSYLHLCPPTLKIISSADTSEHGEQKMIETD